jgi:scyllo-inositol 2-dehydrogenase (NADP+)
MADLGERPRLRVLAAAPEQTLPVALLAFLDRCGVEVSLAGERTPPEGYSAVLVAGPVDEGPLLDYARRGGGVVGLHTALRPPGEVAPETELRVQVHVGHPVTDRLPAELLLRDRLPMLQAAPEGATVLLTASWRLSHHVLAYELSLGEGRLVQLGLGANPAALEHPAVMSLVYRSLRHAAGLEPAPPIGVGLLGYGAVASEHAAAIRQTAGLELRAVCDRSPERRQAAAYEFEVATHATFEGMLEDPAVELVVVGTPPNLHAAGVVEALERGRHVVCEKPFALRARDVDRMVATAAAAGRLLTVYQSRRWDSDFRALRQAVEAGRIGDLFYMESFIGGFSHPCSYWHSHEPISGGTIFDWGSHYFDWILQVFGPRRVRTVSATAHKRVWHDVTNSDQVRVDLRFEGGAEATFLQSDIAAALKPKWYALGTAGAIQGDWTIRDGAAPADSPAVLTLYSPDGSAARLAQGAPEPYGFYGNLADHLLQGEPLAVQAEQARRNVAVMEAATQSIAQGGRVIEVDL